MLFVTADRQLHNHIAGSPNGMPSRVPAPGVLQESSQHIQPPSSDRWPTAQPTAPSPQPPLPTSAAKKAAPAASKDRPADEKIAEDEAYESPMWDPRHIDLLGERLTSSELGELRDMEEQADQPDYMQKVDLLVASKLIIYGIATHAQLFKGKIMLLNSPFSEYYNAYGNTPKAYDMGFCIKIVSA